MHYASLKKRFTKIISAKLWTEQELFWWTLVKKKLFCPCFHRQESCNERDL